MTGNAVVSSKVVKFGVEFELDVGAYELRRAGQPVRLARIPMELLLLLVEQPGQLVTREQIAERVWGKDVFLDIDNGINAVIRRIRQVLEDDPEQPRFIQTVVGRGYRFIATVEEGAPVPAFLSAAEAQPPERDPGATQFVGPGQRNQDAGRLWRIGIAVGSLILLIALGLLFPSVKRRLLSTNSRQHQLK